MDPNIFYTAPEIAAYFKISRALVYRLISQGDIPSVHIGKSVRVRTEDLEKYIQSNMSGSNSDLSMSDQPKIKL